MLCLICQPYIFCVASVRRFSDTELHTGDCNGADEMFVGDVTRKTPHWFSLRFCGGGKLKNKISDGQESEVGGGWVGGR